MSTATIWRTCPHCGAEFGQPDDPGRKRRYCSDACKQAAYRARRRADRRTQHDGHARQHEYDHARQRQQDEERRRQQAREEARRREQRYRAQPPSSSHGHPNESAERARARRVIDALLRKAERTNFPHEAAACRAKAEELRRKYGL